MNNYRNYGNYGNRRVSGNMDDGCRKRADEDFRKSCDCKKEKEDYGMGCGCQEKKSEMSCGCQDRKPEKDRGCNDRRQERDCGCNDKKSEKDCGCCDKKPEKECGCAEETGECTIESMYREVKKSGICRECKEDMPGKSLAMAYVPWQTWKKLYEVCEGFSTGTIFKELDLEFYGRRCN